ncbi:multicopper oxidase family protein [Pseudorhodoplanes sp.]|uniref:multicopper oxidase family protein n=1 Tax=Pseudorhodoplanes sp. TaxID=1934341 RepID=UPI003D0E8F97
MTAAMINRRRVVAGAASLLATGSLPLRTSAAAGAAKELRLVAAPARLSLVGAQHPATEVWCYDGRIPGPEIRVRQGERLRVVVENRLPEVTTVHWHGIRLPNAMDGVPHLTQQPIASGGQFTYEFECPDAGTYWYHPHHSSSEQIGRGLSGSLIVEERDPPRVDRDVTWLLSDWRLLKDASMSKDFGNMHDVSHGGRIGNVVTVNGAVQETFEVRAGERIRLRLINAANARIFALEFEGHAPKIVALDGQPVEPHEPPQGRIVLGPAMRADLVLDMTGAPGQISRVVDRFYASLNYRLLNLVYSQEPARRAQTVSEPLRLPANALAEPALENAERHRIVLGGGMMGQMSAAIMDGKRTDIRTLFQNGLAWAVNGIAARGHLHEPILSLSLNRSHIIELVNDTAWHHPMHLHGHSFRVVSRNGQPTRFREWQDTVLLAPRERADIALVADNPGDWMFHCHILEHQAGGMMGVFRVA